MNKKTLFVVIAVLVAALLVGAFYYYRSKSETPSATNNVATTTAPATAITTTPSTPSITELQLPSLAELQYETAGWQTYENQDYKFKIKYPTGWEHYDKNTFPNGMPGQLPQYKAIEIFRAIKPLSGPDNNGVMMDVFFSTSTSLTPTQESIIYGFEHDYTWHAVHKYKTVSLDGFSGAIILTENDEAKAQISITFHVVNGGVIYMGWYLREDYQNGTSSYPDISYQNQFLPFLASFEVTQ